MSIPGNGAPTLDAVITRMLGLLRLVLPPPEDPLLPTATRLVRVAERPAGLANRVGNETLGLLHPLSLKGGRLEAAVVFEVFGSTEVKAEAAILALQGALAGARTGLRKDGFLRLDGAELSPVQEDAALSAWRKSASYQALFEYSYVDTDGAESLIVRIPTDTDQEEEGTARESMVITGETVRWDDETVPTLRVAGPGGLSGLSTLFFVAVPPGLPPTGAVTLLRTFRGAAGPPTSHATLAAFVTAVTGTAPERHARVEFPSFTDFLNELDPPVDSVELGDWDLDGVPDDYKLRSLDFAAAIGLPEPEDRFEISYATVSPATGFDQKVVLYLRAER